MLWIEVRENSIASFDLRPRRSCWGHFAFTGLH